MEAIKTGYLEIQAICVEYCIEDESYLKDDSHIIFIPEKIFYDFINLKSINERSSFPLYVGIRNSQAINKRLYFGRIEPSINTANSTNEMAILPRWVVDNLEIDGISETIDIVFISTPKLIDYIKVKANISDYVKFPNIKEILEEKLSTYNCVNINTYFIVENVRFKIIEIRDVKGIDINFGSLFDQEIKIDFDLPEDYIEEIPMPMRAYSEPQISECKDTNETTKGAIKEGRKEGKGEYKVFQNSGLKLDSKSDLEPRQLTRQEIIEERLKRFSNNPNS